MQQELIENALDANAKSIVVEASPDLIAHIQVKDNGLGIPPADRKLSMSPDGRLSSYPFLVIKCG
jgi:DNA mismatch repair ATPase MutL